MFLEYGEHNLETAEKETGTSDGFFKNLTGWITRSNGHNVAQSKTIIVAGQLSKRLRKNKMKKLKYLKIQKNFLGILKPDKMQTTALVKHKKQTRKNHKLLKTSRFF